MTLEEFFTRTELKDGLVSPSRVEELVTCMQKDENLVVKNVSDASRQWAVVASTIAATKNKNCLDSFMRLGGLQCLCTWLKDAQKFSSESTDIVEESISAILRAFENLSPDLQQSISSGIRNSVKDLLGHCNVQIQGTARTLLDTWKVDTSNNAVQSNSSSFSSHPNHEVSVSTGESTCLHNSVAESRDGIKEGQHAAESPDTENMSLTNSVEVEPEKGGRMHLQIQKTEHNKFSADPINSIQEKAPNKEQHVMASANTTLVETCSFTCPKEDGNGKGLDASKIDEVRKDAVLAKEHGSSSRKLDLPADSDSRSNRTMPVSSIAELSSGEDDRHGKCKDLKALSSQSGDIEAGDEDKENSSSDESAGLGNVSCSATQDQFVDKTDNETTEMKLEYGILDALEVATKVAQEVAREVDQREPSSSSSERISGRTRQPDTPDSINGKQESYADILTKEVSVEVNNHVETRDERARNEVTSDCPHLKPENAINDTESSQVTEAAEEPADDKQKALCDFDLNEEVCFDGMEHEVNSTSTLTPAVSASQPGASQGLPVTQMQFEASRGRKASTVDNAACPASPCRKAGSNKAEDGLKKKGFIDIDLNVAEEVDDKNNDLSSRKQIPVSSGLPSTESSLEVKSPGKSERLKWDLNSPPAEARIAGQFDHRSGSLYSISSSVPPPRRNIDLNDGPDTQFDSSLQGQKDRSSITLNPYEKLRSGAPAISLMGTKVEIDRKESSSQGSFLANGKAQKSQSDLHTARLDAALQLAPSLSCTRSPVYGYSGPATPGPSFSSAPYGPVGSVPYMVDWRGAPVVPHILGPAPTISSMYHQPPFILSMTGAPSAMNVSAQTRPGLEVNSGFLIGGNTENMGLKQFFMPGQGRLIEEHVRANSQPSSSSGLTEKRKEPEGGFERDPFNYRRQPPW